MVDKIFYNEASAAKLGWTPEWFGAYEFDDDLLRKIRNFQRNHNLKVDGLCGPTTFRRIRTAREAQLESYQQREIRKGASNHIIYNNEYYPIDWDKVVLPFNANGLKITKGYKKMTKQRKPKYFVAHWDVCLNSESCHKVLTRRGLSVHFAIDNDGTIYQFLDMNHVAYHAGGKFNTPSVGVEISNAYYPKYQSWYKRHGFGERPIVEGAHVHGKSMKPFMDFYPVQVDALKALMKAVHGAMPWIPLECPLDSKGETSYTVDAQASKNRFSGYLSHYHLTKRKIDCANLDLAKLLEEIKNEAD
tara:strand:+ start:3277 stop:4185 length:909 start_codon:yes stop_codon:yes gene_type:complete